MSQNPSGWSLESLTTCSSMHYIIYVMLCYTLLCNINTYKDWIFSYDLKTFGGMSVIPLSDKALQDNIKLIIYQQLYNVFYDRLMLFCHKCCTTGTCNVFLWQSFRNHQIIRKKKVKPVLLKKKKKKLW